MASPPCMNLHIQPNLADLAQSTIDYPFRILPYFSLIIRAIGVLEGIALVGNPDFAIVDEASYPCIAQAGFRCPRRCLFWLLISLATDETPCLRNALRYAIYGKSGVFDTERFIDMMQASDNFITAGKSWGGENMNGNMAEHFLIWPQSVQPVQTRAAFGFLLSDKGNFF